MSQNQNNIIQISDEYRLLFDSSNMQIERFKTVTNKDKTKQKKWVLLTGYYQQLNHVKNKLNALRIADMVGDITKLAESEAKFEKMIKNMDNLIITGKERIVMVTKTIHTTETVELTKNKKTGEVKKTKVGTKTTVKVEKETSNKPKAVKKEKPQSKPIDWSKLSHKQSKPIKESPKELNLKNVDLDDDLF